MKISPDKKKRIAALVEQSGLSLPVLAGKIGTSYSTLWNFLYGQTLNFGKIQELADALQLSLYQLTCDNFDDNAARLAPAADPASRQTQAITPPDFAKIPLYQATAPDDTYSLAGEVAEYAPRLIGEGIARIFAVKVRGDTMSPRYYWGDIVYCGRNIAPKPGDDCLIELDDHIAHLKIYVGEKDGAYVFRQLNPALEWRCPIADIRALHRVVGRL